MQEKYVKQSLETHAMFARIMAEHNLFLALGFSPRDSDLKEEALSFQKEFEGILSEVIEEGYGLISKDIINSGELVTEFTEDSEMQVEELTGLEIDNEITQKELQLRNAEEMEVTSELTDFVKEINNEVLDLLDELIEFQEEIVEQIDDDKAMSLNYPLLVKHVLRESKVYKYYIMSIEEGKDLDEECIWKTEMFWSRQLMEHALFIRGQLDPNPQNESLIETADTFAEKFKRLLAKTKKASDEVIDSVTDATLKEAVKLSKFKKAGVEGLLNSEILSISNPLMVDHILRENLRYIRILKNSK